MITLSHSSEYWLYHVNTVKAFSLWTAEYFWILFTEWLWQLNNSKIVFFGNEHYFVYIMLLFQLICTNICTNAQLTIFIAHSVFLTVFLDRRFYRILSLYTKAERSYFLGKYSYFVTIPRNYHRVLPTKLPLVDVVSIWSRSKTGQYWKQQVIFNPIPMTPPGAHSHHKYIRSYIIYILYKCYVLTD